LKIERTNPVKPNVIVFFTDQQRWDTTGVHGNPLGLTPHFDRMAQKGTHVYNSFTCQPVCGPARSCLQTGMYATQSGCYRNNIPLPKGTKTLAHYFRENGFRTGYIGKWHLADQEPVPEEGRGGYEHWLASNVLEYSSDAYDTVMYNNDCEPVKLPGYRVDAMTDAAIRFIDENQEQPFYLFLSYLEPHHQNHLDSFPAPDGYEESYIGKWSPPDLATLGGSSARHLPGYFGMVKRLDEALGRMTEALKSLKLLENTIILFTSDHGCHFKTRNAEYKRSCHDSSIRVPTAVQGPGFTGGGRITELVSLIDIPPTLLDAAGIPVPDHMMGKSILPLVRTRGTANPDWKKEVFVQISEDKVARAIRTDRWKYSVVAPAKSGWNDSGSDVYEEEFLYDLHADPYELDNIIGVEWYREITEELRERLLARMADAGEKQPIITAAPSRKAAVDRRVEVKELRENTVNWTYEK
jgi:arylsulfatase A-like enzyme